MNKFAASLGFVALGTSVLHAVESSSLNSNQSTKPWSVGVSLRGFYDSNIDTAPNGQSSYGYEIAPEFDFGLAGDQTSFNLGYALSALYYEQRPLNSTDKWQFTQTIDLGLTHTFSPRVDMSLSDAFVIGHQPDSLRAGNLPLSTTQVVSGDNMINYGGIEFNIDVTQLLGLKVGYNNAYYNYDDDTISYFPTPPNPPNTFESASTAGLLNRVDNFVVLDTQWKLRPQTMGILGYTYSQSIYTADQVISVLNTGQVIYSDNRDRRGQTMYAGAQHAFTPTLSGLLKAGATYSDYYNDPTSDNQWTPYVQANLTYMFQTTTSMQLGFLYSLSAANVANISGVGGNSSYVLDQETILFYGSITHEIVKNLIGTAKATVQDASYNGGGPGVDGQGYLFLELGFDLGYEFTKNLSAHVGYNYDNNDSDVPGETYHRNRVYIGVTGTY